MEELYSFYNKKRKIVLNSSSGGAFYTLSSFVLKNLHGVVYGVASKQGKIIHCRIDNLKKLYFLMRSKYVKADFCNTFNECYEDLKNGLTVLYVGLPCEIFVLRTYLEKRNVILDHLICVDLICHGVPSQDVWEIYLQEKFGKQKIEDVNFRYKKLGWEKYFIRIKTNKKTYVSFKRKDEFMRAFSGAYSLMPSCYKCIYKGKNHYSDLTIGDFWNVKKYSCSYNKKGTSLIVFHNDNVKNALVPALKQYGSINKIDVEILKNVNPSYYYSTVKPDNFQKYCDTFEKEGFIKAVNAVSLPVNYSLKIKIVNKIKSLLNKN